MKRRKWVRNADFATRAILGWGEWAAQGRGEGGEKLENKSKNEENHKHAGFEDKGKVEAVDKITKKQPRISFIDPRNKIVK